jgi:hypothetical protein
MAATAPANRRALPPGADLVGHDGNVAARIVDVCSREALVSDAVRPGADPDSAHLCFTEPGPVMKGIPGPDGRHVAIEYRSPTQIMDPWPLDVETLEWVHAASMSVHAMIKRPAPDWTSNGRLAVVGYFGTEPESRHLLVVWHPEDQHLATQEVGDDATFVVV